MGVHDKCCSKTKEKLKAWKQNLKTPQFYCTFLWRIIPLTDKWAVVQDKSCLKAKGKLKAWKLNLSSWHFSTENHITYWQMSCSQWGFTTNVAQKQKRRSKPESKILKLHEFMVLFYGESYHLDNDNYKWAAVKIHDKCRPKAKEYQEATKQQKSS